MSTIAADVDDNGENSGGGGDTTAGRGGRRQFQIVFHFVILNYVNRNSVTEEIVRINGKLIDREDAVTLLTVLVQSRLAKYGDDGEMSDRQPGVYFDTDEGTRKIKQLYLTGDTLKDGWKLPVDVIGRFEMLDYLTLNRCCSIRSPRNTVLKKLKNLKLSYSYVDEDEITGTRFFQLLPSLEVLYLYKMEEEKMPTILDDLRNNCVFHDSLQKFALTESACDDDHGVMLLLDFPRMCPDLHMLDLDGNKIKSLKKVAREIQRRESGGGDRSWRASTRVRGIDLNGNPLIQKILKLNREETEAVKTVLRSLKGLYYVGIRHRQRQKAHSDIEYEMKVNHAGRKLLTGDARTGRKAVRTELWATALERSYNKSNRVWDLNNWNLRAAPEATGVYDLLRHGPFLHRFLHEER